MQILLGIMSFVLANSFPVLVHHGTVNIYDQTQKITMKGSVTDFTYRNPHVQIGFDAKDGKGKVVHWTAEGVGIYAWSKAGWKKDSLKPGDQITITLFPSKAGTPIGEIIKLLTSDGLSFTIDNL